MRDRKHEVDALRAHGLLPRLAVRIPPHDERALLRGGTGPHAREQVRVHVVAPSRPR